MQIIDTSSIMNYTSYNLSNIIAIIIARPADCEIRENFDRICSCLEIDVNEIVKRSSSSSTSHVKYPKTSVTMIPLYCDNFSFVIQFRSVLFLMSQRRACVLRTNYCVSQSPFLREYIHSSIPTRCAVLCTNAHAVHRRCIAQAGLIVELPRLIKPLDALISGTSFR